MTIPTDAVTITGTLDPHEEIDCIIDCSGILEEGEQIESGYSLDALAEATALGFTFMTGSGRDHARIESNRSIKFWVTIDALFQDNAAFDEDVSLPIMVTFVTNSVPARTRQRTLLVPFKQR